MTVSTLAKGIVDGIILFLIFYGMVNGVNHTTASTSRLFDEYDGRDGTGSGMPAQEDASIENHCDRYAACSCRTVSADGKRCISLDLGAIYCLIGALFYAIYIIVIDKVAKGPDAFLISIIQLGIASLLGALFMCLLETPSLPQTPLQWGAILGLGLICSAYGFVVQPIAQRYTSPEKIGLIFSLEPVFSALLSYIFLHEILGIQGYIGQPDLFCRDFHRIIKETTGFILPKIRAGSLLAKK